jgi:hypothetical protein
MTGLLRRSRGLWVALAALALTAGVALAAATPSTPHSSLAGPNVPAASHEPDENEGPEASGPPADSHGGLVSAAAQMSTPPGFANHGAFVSCIARMHGATLTGFDWTSVTAASCKAAAPGRSGE